MPVYRYKAVTRDGQIVQNRRIEEKNKFILLRNLKKNNLMPIEVVQMNVKNKSQASRKRRNIEGTNSVLKDLRTQELEKKISSNRNDKIDNLRKKLFSNIKITNRDLVVFTQNLYLLKRADFNNIHALSTIIESTENQTLRNIIEDILIGVESGENMYTTMEYYTGVFPTIYTNMVKVGELSRRTNKSIKTSNNIFR